MKIELQEVSTNQLGLFQPILFDEIRIELLCLPLWLELDLYKVRIADTNMNYSELVEFCPITNVEIQRLAFKLLFSEVD